MTTITRVQRIKDSGGDGKRAPPTVEGLAVSVKLSLAAMMKKMKTATYFAKPDKMGGADDKIILLHTVEFGNSALNCLYGLYRRITTYCNKEENKTKDSPFPGGYKEVGVAIREAGTETRLVGIDLDTYAATIAGTINENKGKDYQTISDGKDKGYFPTQEGLRVVVSCFMTYNVYYDVPAYAQTVNQIFAYFLKFVGEMDNAMNLSMRLKMRNREYSFKQQNPDLGRILYPHMALSTARAEVRNAIAKCTGIGTDLMYLIHTDFKKKIQAELPLKLKKAMDASIANEVVSVLSEPLTESERETIIRLVIALVNFRGANVATSFNFPPILISELSLEMIKIFNFKGQGFWRIYQAFQSHNMHTYLPMTPNEAKMFFAMVISGLHYDNLQAMKFMFKDVKLFTKRLIIDPIYTKKSEITKTVAFTLPQLVKFPKAIDQVINVGKSAVDNISNQLGSKTNQFSGNYVSNLNMNALAGGKQPAQQSAYQFAGSSKAGTLIADLIKLTAIEDANFQNKKAIVGTKSWYDASKLATGFAKVDDSVVSLGDVALNLDRVVMWASDKDFGLQAESKRKATDSSSNVTPKNKASGEDDDAGEGSSKRVKGGQIVLMDIDEQ